MPKTFEEIREEVQNVTTEYREIQVRQWPEFPKCDFGIISEITEEATRKSEIDPAAIALTSLVFAGAAFGADSYLKVGDSKHYPRLFAVLVGASSRGRKGSSADPVQRVFTHAKDTPPISPGPLSSGEGLIYAVRDASDKQDQEGNPLDLGVDDKRLLVHDGEFASVLKAAKRESNTLSAIIRTAWDSGNIEPLTKTPKNNTTGAHISFVSHITREELKSSLSEVDGFNGFSNRILWCCVRRQNETAFPEGISDQKAESLGKVLSGAILLARRGGMVTWDQEAKTIYEKSYPILTRDESGLLGAATSRAEAQVIRLALIFALLDESRTIQKTHITRAIAIWNYCLKSARYLFGSLEVDSRENKILEYLQTGEKKSTEITKELFRGHVSGLGAVLENLQAKGRITSRVEMTSGRSITFWALANAK
ncbi:MAG: DUF3987 domain-containing protein [Leptospirales bacterium]